MHNILKTELMKVNNATWINVKVCIKSKMLKLELSLEILGLFFCIKSQMLKLELSLAILGLFFSEGGVPKILNFPKLKCFPN